MMHVPLSGISKKVTLSDRIYVWSVLCLSEETLLLRPPFLTFPLARYLWDFELNSLTIVHFVLGPINVFEQSPRPNIQFWALTPTIIIIINQFFFLISFKIFLLPQYIKLNFWFINYNLSISNLYYQKLGSFIINSYCDLNIKIIFVRIKNYWYIL